MQQGGHMENLSSDVIWNHILNTGNMNCSLKTACARGARCFISFTGILRLSIQAVFILLRVTKERINL